MKLQIEKNIIEAELMLQKDFAKAEEIALYNQNKVLQAFIKNKISPVFLLFLFHEKLSKKWSLAKRQG